MTTIAFDGRSIASDTLEVNGHITQAPFSKLRESGCGRFVYAITGFSAWFDAWIRWFEPAAKAGLLPMPEAAPKWTGGDRAQGNFIAFDRRDGRAYQFGCDLPYPQECFAPAAWGSGEDYAMGAMKAGADAAKAVSVAIECDVYTGGEVRVIEFQPKATITKKALTGKLWVKAPLKAAEVDSARSA